VLLSAWFLKNQQNTDFVPNCAIAEEACWLMEIWCLEVWSKLAHHHGDQHWISMTACGPEEGLLASKQRKGNI